MHTRKDPDRDGSVVFSLSRSHAPARNRLLHTAGRTPFHGPARPGSLRKPGAWLQEGWVIANHILVSFHVAFISSVLALPAVEIFKAEVLKFIFFSPETLVSAAFMYISFHAGIALHEMGHFVTAARLNALNDRSQQEAGWLLHGSPLARVSGLIKTFVLAPYGKASGIKREGLNYYPDAPYNLAVAAAGPRASGMVALVAIPPAALLLGAGLALDATAAIYAGRLLLGIGVVSLLDRLLADPGKYREFKQREKKAGEKAAAVERGDAWVHAAAIARHRMLTGRIQEFTHRELGPVSAAWQFRNCGMGGRHTEKQYPESNVSMQEAMFLILGAQDYQEAQEMTVRLQNRLKEVIEKAEGCRVMGIGLEGGLAPYIERDTYPLPEVRLWAMMKQTIEECGYRPGVDVAIALDPAMSELEIAYRKEFNVPDAVGMYLCWRDKSKTVLDRDAVLDIYVRAIEEYDIPILSIEDGFSENDFEGWKMLLDRLGDRILVIGDDLVTTNDATIELAASKGLINTALIKANQIGSLYETLLAMLVALGKGMELVVSHRSKSPNDDMEAQISLAANSLGLKAGGGANTERLVKYHAVTEMMGRGARERGGGLGAGHRAIVDSMAGYEEPTNAGIPTVGVTASVMLPETGVDLEFRGATPLGTSAGSGEAIHLVDKMIERSEYREVIESHPGLFRDVEPGVVAFDKGVDDARVKALADEDLSDLFERTQRYEGMGCLTAAGNIREFIDPAFKGCDVSRLGIKDIDRTLLELELDLARRRGKLSDAADATEEVRVKQRKQNLGMNAMLSVSLALSRAVAHLQGKHLYEVLREEMNSIIGQLAHEHGVTVEGSTFSDYVAALRKVNEALERDGRSLFEELRTLTAIYGGASEAPAVAPGGDGGRREQARPPAGDPAATPAPSPGVETTESEAHRHSVVATATSPEPVTLTPEQEESLVGVSEMLHSAFWGGEDPVARHFALHRYQTLKESLAPFAQGFGIVNNRIFTAPEGSYIPYLVSGTLFVHWVKDGNAETVFTHRVPDGRILTDRLLGELAGVDGRPIDFEHELSELDPAAAEPVRVGRLRDIAEQLRRINRGVNRSEAVFVLRSLVARLSLFSLRQYLNAKNLQPEVATVLDELTRFVNSIISERRPFLVRMLVRNVASVVTKPKLIDNLWNATIDLAEIHLRGSDIANELRRSSHHAVGRHTLELARAYMDYLDTGNTDAIARFGYPDPGPVDVEARRREEPKELLAQIIGYLESLLGSSETVAHIREWQQDYDSILVRCDFGRSIDDELAATVEGLRSENRWVYYHHLRVIKGRAGDFVPGLPTATGILDRIDALLNVTPGDPSCDVEATEAELRGCVADFTEIVRDAYETDLFQQLDEFLELYQRNEFYDTFHATSRLRRNLRKSLNQHAFPEQRLLLFRLDCLLEEMGYVALRHVASEYEDQGLDLERCLDIIRTCVFDLTHDGLYSRQLRDLADMLNDPTRTRAEVRNVLEQVQRNYQHVVHRVITPFEQMKERLGFDDEELRIALANMQRYMHDLNSIAAFLDIARAHLGNEPEGEDRGLGISAPERRADRPKADILHISHIDEIDGLVENDDSTYSLRDWYGSKGSGLVYISYLRLPTRDGFIIPTTFARDGRYDGDATVLERDLDEHLGILEGDINRRNGTAKVFGDPARPLLLAVRGGSVFSMPGMLATVLFVGMNDEIAEGLAREDPWCAYDSYRRFLASYGAAVWGVDMEEHDLVDIAKRKYDVEYKTQIPWEGMKEIAEHTKALLREEGYGNELDEALRSPRRQLATAVQAVLDSWSGEGTKRYRDIKTISDSWRTAVTVQEMALGNFRTGMNGSGIEESEASLTGVIPRTRVDHLGVRVPTGDFKFSAPGEDLVGGLTRAISFRPMSELGAVAPMLDRRLSHCAATLRRFMGTDQEIEFTVERGNLSLLQSRAAEIGANRVATAFADESGETARGIGVRGGAFRGLVVFDESELREVSSRDLSQRDDVDGVLVVVENPSPSEIPMILLADGVMAARGGSTSHVAIAVNGIEGREYYAVVGVDGLRVNAEAREAHFVDRDGNTIARITSGDVVSIHGRLGGVYVGSRELRSA